MIDKRVSKNQRPYLQKAKESALLAIEVYNKPAIKFRSAGYIALMVIAWTALLHVIFIRKGVNPFYKLKDGSYDIVDGDYRHWELKECVKQYWGTHTENPIRKNLEFFIPLRNKIEHRHIPELDASIFGECQAFLLNFDAMLGEYFGVKHQLRESLSFSLQLFPSGDSFAQAVRSNKALADVKKFIDDYRSMLSSDVTGSGQFSFKAFLIQVAGHETTDTLPIQFVQYDKLSTEQQEGFEKFAVMVKMQNSKSLNDGMLRTKSVIREVQQKLGNPKIQRPSGLKDKFNQNTHHLCWKRYKVRPPTGAEKPENTDQKYCSYDKAHRDYLYTKAWVDFITEKMSDGNEYNALFEK